MDVSSIKKIGIIGAGQMGNGITQVAAAAGMRTQSIFCEIVCDVAEAAAHAACVAIALHCLRSRKRLRARPILHSLGTKNINVLKT